jgi:hypothetical protein
MFVFKLNSEMMCKTNQKSYQTMSCFKTHRLINNLFMKNINKLLNAWLLGYCLQVLNFKKLFNKYLIMY